MRPSPPEELKLDAQSLLDDVRDRLAHRVPGWDGSPDPTDPAWLLLEEAAWMVELLSEQLNEYPFKVVQQFVHLLGAHLRPARPAMGVVVVDPAEAGVLRGSSESPAPWRFFSPQTEDRDLIEFSLLEAEAPVRPGAIESLVRIVDGQLQRVGDAKSGVAGLAGWVGEGQRSGAFDGERIEFTLTSANSKALLEQLRGAIAALAEKKLGWLVLDAKARGTNEVVMTARVDPTAALEQGADSTVSAGGDLEAPWASLDGTAWTPPVRVADHPVVPVFLRGRTPLPGRVDGTIVIPDLPAQLELSGLLHRVASPMPQAVIDAIWRNLTYLDTALAKLRPAIRRELPGAGKSEPAWVSAAVAGPVWERLLTFGTTTVAHLGIRPAGRGPGTMRVALIVPSQGDVPPIHAFGMEAGALTGLELPAQAAWTLPVPAGDGRAMGRVVAFDVRVGARHESLVVAVAGDVEAVLLNAVAIINAPVVPDGRGVTIERAVPEAASLQFEDLVTPAVVEDVREQPIPDAIRELLESLPLARFSVPRRAAIENFSGVGVDPSSGELTFNAPDEGGRVRRLRPGTEITLDWYRRTDGAAGDVPAGAIQFVEAPPGASPQLVGARNPVGTFFGSDRESEDAAQERLFGPAGDVPVLAADWERAIHVELGERGGDWTVRVWTYAERSLLSHRLWPPTALGVDEETERLRAALTSAGPDRLLVVLGPPDALLDEGQLDWARSVVDGLVNRVRRRVPAIRSALVTRLWPLVWVGGMPGAEGLPAFDLAGAGGLLRDPNGREAPAPDHGILLNAAAVEVEEYDG